MQGEVISEWFRDNLSEHAAEIEVRTTRNGTFLVWRCRSPIDLYISYVDHDDLVHHLPIKQLGRFFFLQGIKFCSLSELVIHHLTMREFSENPVKIINSNKCEKLEATHIALVNIDHVPGQPAFCVYRGDLLAEIGRIDGRWLLAKHLPSESSAFFDLTQTSILSDLDATPIALPYFHECTAQDHDELVQRLAEGGRGSFLIRQSRHTAEAYALLVHTGCKIDKFLLIKVKSLPVTPFDSPNYTNNNNDVGNSKSRNRSFGTLNSGWLLSGRVFPTISQIVHRYSIRAIQDETRLTHAVLSEPSEDIKEVTSSTDTTSIKREIQENDRGADERIIVASVSAFYKSREDKDWRACTLALYEHAGSAILRLGDTSRNEPHVLVLHHTELVCLHESMLGREATVFLSPLQNESGVFLSFEPLHFFYTWFHLLRRYTVQRRVDALSSSFSSSMSFFVGTSGESTTEMSLLYLHVDKFKGSPLKADTPYRVSISLNGVRVAQTAYQMPSNYTSVVFDANFLLIVTSWSCNVQLTISASGKTRPAAVSSLMSVPVSSMISSLSSSSSEGSSDAGLSAVERKVSSAQPFVVTAIRQRVIVLSRDAYAPLMESFLGEVLTLAEWSSGRLPAAQRNQLCSVMVSLVWPHSLRALIELTLGKCIKETSGDNMLRQDSFASCLITAALRMSGKAMLESNLIKKRPKRECHTEESLVEILSEVARIPAVSLVLACVAATVADHLPTADKEYVVRRAISATFVLRFANPLIISTLTATGEGPTLARSVQVAANAATMHNFVREVTGEGTATQLFDLFERVRDSAVQTVMVEAYDTAPEQMGLLCHLLALTLVSNSAYCRHPPPCSIASSPSSSTAVTTSTVSSNVSSSTGVDSFTTVESDLLSSFSTSSSSSSSNTVPQGRPEVTPRIMRLLELHRN